MAKRNPAHTQGVPNPLETARKARCVSALERSEVLFDRLLVLDAHNIEVMLSAQASADHSASVLKTSTALNHRIDAWLHSR